MLLCCYLLDDANVHNQLIICMGARGHGQGGPPENAEKCCCTLITNKCCQSLGRPTICALFLKTCHQLLGVLPQTHNGALPLNPAGGLPPTDPLICPPLEKFPGATMIICIHLHQMSVC